MLSHVSFEVNKKGVLITIPHISFKDSHFFSGAIRGTFYSNYITFTKEEVFERLRTRNVTDLLECTLNEDFSVITFKDNISEISYTFSVCKYENNDYLIIRLEQFILIPGKCRIPKKSIISSL